MRLTIGIVNYNTKDDLKECLTSINENAKGLEYSIIVVDNNSTDGSQEFIKSLNGKTFSFIILNKENKGFGSACNQIAKKTRTPYLLFLNPDVLVTKGSIERLDSFMKEHPEVVLATGKLLNLNGTLQLSCRRFPTILRALFGRASLSRKLFPDNPITRNYMLTELDYNSIQYPDWIRGAVMMVRTKLFSEVRGFDEQFFLYLEDTDLCLRFRKKGYEIAYVPDAVFYHKLGGSTKKKALETQLIHNISMFYYIEKNLGYNQLSLFLIRMALSFRLSLLFGVWIIKRMKE
jgi:GT2 family glycosyltransferase